MMLITETSNIRNFVKFGGNDGDGDYQNNSDWRGKNYTDFTGGGIDGNPSPVDIRQSYCVVAFIIKTVE